MSRPENWTPDPRGTAAPPAPIPVGTAGPIPTGPIPTGVRISPEIEIRRLTLVSTEGASKLVGVPLCPDLLRLSDLGEADTLRGRIIRALFRLLERWPTP